MDSFIKDKNIQFDPWIGCQNDGENILSKDTKQDDDQLKSEVMLENLIDGYLDVLKNWIPKFKNLEESDPSRDIVLSLKIDKGKEPDHIKKIEKKKNAPDQIWTLDVVPSQVVQGPVEGAILHCACESWLKNVEEVRSKGNLKSSDISVEEGMMNIGRCYWDGIKCGIVAVLNEEKVLELYPKPAENKNPDTQYYLGSISFVIRELGKVCED
ncbi:1663_t:CDS:2 [Gigaspora rosea]|nr:1663_t:CDS:2 [Gigaspora rosea]